MTGVRRIGAGHVNLSYKKIFSTIILALDKQFVTMKPWTLCILRKTTVPSQNPR